MPWRRAWQPTLVFLPGEVHGNPLLYSCLDNPKDRGVWWAKVQGATESDMTEQLIHRSLLLCDQLTTHSPQPKVQKQSINIYACRSLSPLQVLLGRQVIAGLHGPQSKPQPHLYLVLPAGSGSLRSCCC